MFKILLLGTNQAVISDFFNQLSDSFELLSCSLRYEDVIAHLKYVEPDAIIYCLKSESKDSMSQTITLKKEIQHKIPFFIIGNEAECHNFKQCAANVADYTLVKPINAQKIKHSITQALTQSKKTPDMQQTDEPAAKPTTASVPEAKASSTTTASAKSDSLFSIDDAELDSLISYIDELTENPHATANIKQPQTASQKSEPAAPKMVLQKNTPPSRKHILVVDDDVQLQKTIRYQLEDHYDIASAISGELALRFVQKKHTDLILLDYEMPEMNGSEVLERLRENPDTRNIPVIFLTGIAEKEKIRKALSLKPQGYVLKPASKETLLKIITDTLGHA